ncbi:polyamine aminopropyltransferase [Breznakiella homolactica]|uniref:Polyamine aminopropyltransferase n=1 Tax=Breznakiella homolactica TaxID=2798577 RepID=A0A7T8BAG1_9SPIR|nr:polyamine aminopropyltransferase [Breznakiella homolactica]QQO09482.1 polyamine aminopropyltransferase [Breznakiella homolactica]
MREFLEKREIRERYSRTSGWFYETGKTLYSGHTNFQDIELVETDEFGVTLLLDGATQVMEKVEFQYHEPMVHIPMLAHPEPKRVLIIGGGDGGSLREVLRHSTVEQVDFAELDQDVVAFARTHLSSLNGGAFEDSRVKIYFTDGRHFVEKSDPNLYDIIIMDMTDPSGPSLKLYTADFFQSVMKTLKDDESFFVMHSESPEARPEAFSRIHRTLKSVFPVVRGAYTFVRMYGTFWSFAVASGKRDPANVPRDIISWRITERNITSLKLISSKSWPALFAEYPYIEELLAAEGPISTDENPDFPDTFDPRN